MRMSILKRWVIAVVIIIALGGLIELGLRLFMPTLIEGGSRVALRVPQGQEVSVSTEGSMALNALRWRISGVTITAEGVPLSDAVSTTAELSIGSLPLFPAIGNLSDGTATFTVPAEHLDNMAQMVSGGFAQWAEMREGQLVTGGVLSDQQFDLPYSPSFEIPYETTVELGVENGQITVTPSGVSVQDQGVIGEFLSGAMAETRTVCFADRLPKGVSLTEIEVRPSGEFVLHAALSEGLLSNPDERSRGTCE